MQEFMNPQPGQENPSQWQEQGGAYVDVLEGHVTQATSLTRKHQEFLLHVVLNADHHTSKPNISKRALDLLLHNATLHPPCVRDTEVPCLLRTNPELWSPGSAIGFETQRDAHAAVCEASHFSPAHGSPKHSFLLTLLLGAAAHGSRQLYTAPTRVAPAPTPAKGGQAAASAPMFAAGSSPGPLGCALALRYVTHLVEADMRARNAIYAECGHRGAARNEGDLKAGNVLAGSILATMLSLESNLTMTGGFAAWHAAVAAIMHALAGLVLLDFPPDCGSDKRGRGSSATPGYQPMPLSLATPARSQRVVSQVPEVSQTPGPGGPVAGGGVVSGPGVGFVPASELVKMGRTLLHLLYDLGMDLEVESPVVVVSKEAKDTDCRFFALATHELLTGYSHKRPLVKELSDKLSSAGGKSLLLSALSPRAAMHVLCFGYALHASKRWEQFSRETVLPPSLTWLMPLKDYAEYHTPVRQIVEGGAPSVSAVAVLKDLDVLDHFTTASRTLLSPAAGGGGFATWLAAFAAAAAMGVFSGGGGKGDAAAAAELKAALSAVLARATGAEAEGGGSAADGDAARHEHDRRCFAKARLVVAAL
ncbi:hypothetical protein FOA52_016085 [Chlamydomonas sp. UWO 241]|nr:hypothetical protein FOA52_016085 [Chlamydomonas sp. UWO 241]